MTVRDVIILSGIFKLKVSEMEPLLNEKDYLSALKKVKGNMFETFDENTIVDCMKNVENVLNNERTFVITYWDEAYPPLLREIDDPPAFLFVKGEKPEVLRRDPKIAVVGSRKLTAYGKKIAGWIARELASAGCLVVSGLAAGVDSEAHLGACVSGETIGVLGNGIDLIYPRFNTRVYERVMANGVIISEFLPGTPPSRWNFPRRNRIIAGMCVGVVVIEATEKSGSLITANLAAQYGRDVFAVPGPITSDSSRGTNFLIKHGAKLVQDINDILEEYPTFASSVIKNVESTELSFSEDEKELLSLITKGNDTLEKLITVTGWEMGRLLTGLSSLEVQEKITQVGGRYLTL